MLSLLFHPKASIMYRMREENFLQYMLHQQDSVRQYPNRDSRDYSYLRYSCNFEGSIDAIDFFVCFLQCCRPEEKAMGLCLPSIFRNIPYKLLFYFCCQN